MEIALVFVCIIFVVIAFFTKTHGGSFFLGKRNSGLVSITLSICATWIGSASLLALSGWAVTFGASAVWYLIFPGIGLIALSLIGVDKIRAKKGLAISDYNDNKHFRASISIFLLFLYLMILSAQFTGFAKIAGQFNLDYVFGLILSASIVSVYVAMGGFDSVKNTDIAQASLIILSVILIVIFMPYKFVYPQVSTIFSLDNNLPGSLFMLFLSSGFLMLASQENHQRIKSATNAKVAKQACLISGFILIALSILIVSIGLSVPDQTIDPIFHILDELNNPLLSFFIAIGIMAAALSTADSALNIASYSASSIFNSNRTNTSHVIACSLFAIAIAYLIPSVGKIILICINLYIGVILPTIIGVFLNRSPTALMFILCFSSITVAIGYGLSLMAPGLIGLVIGVTTVFLKSSSLASENVEIKK